MLFTHFDLMQGEKIEAWFVYQAHRQYFGVEYTAYPICQQIHTKIYPLAK